MADAKHYRDAEGNHLGGFSSADDKPHPDVPAGAIECPAPPSGKAKWVNGAWEYTPPYDRVRKLMYEDAGITEDARVDAMWDAVSLGDNTKLVELQALRDAVRADPLFPAKPEE